MNLWNHLKFFSLSPACLVLAAGFCLPTRTLAQTDPVSTSQQGPAGGFASIGAAASAARDQHDVPQAIQLYSQAVALNPKWPDGWWFLGVLQYGADQYEPARDALTHFIELTPNAGPALALRGLCEFELAQYPESLHDLDAGIAIGAASQPRNAQILLYHQAILLGRVGRFEEAIGKYGYFVKEKKIDDNIVAGIGLAGLRLPLLPKEVDPAQAQLVTMTGNAAIAVMGADFAAGQQDFADLFQRFPQTANLHYFYGYLLFATHPDDAVAQFRLELTVAPNSALAHTMLAWASGLEGNYSETLPDAQKAAAEDPSLPMAQLVLGRALVETGDVAGGLPHLERVLQAEPGNLEARITLAKAYSKLGRKDDARRERLLCLQLAGQEAPPNATP